MKAHSSVRGGSDNRPRLAKLVLYEARCVHAILVRVSIFKEQPWVGSDFGKIFVIV